MDVESSRKAKQKQSNKNLKNERKKTLFERVTSAECDRDGTRQWKKLFPVTRRSQKKLKGRLRGKNAQQMEKKC